MTRFEQPRPPSAGVDPDVAPAGSQSGNVDDDDAIRELVTRLSRPHPSGGRVIERAAILAAGSNNAAIMSWIAAHGGEPEPVAPAKSRPGLVVTRVDAPPRARRYVLPDGVFD